jgi:ABC-2 type transport system permease protein
MTFLGPLLMASVWIVPLVLATKSEGVKVIDVVDETGLFYEQFKNTGEMTFNYVTDDVQKAKENLAGSEHFGVLYVPKTEFSLPISLYLYTSKKPGLNMKLNLEEQISQIVKNRKLQDVYGIDPEVLASVKSDVSLVVEDLTTSKTSYTELSWALGFIGGMLIYFFIFMYGSQVMRGVIEEKTSRIVEVIVSSVKPIQLMLGKIIGIAMVGLTQFLLWIVLTLGIVTIFTAAYTDQLQEYRMTGKTITNPSDILPSDAMGLPDTSSGSLEALSSDENVAKLLDIFFSINYGLIIGMFLFYFVGGYLLYAALFAAIGSAVDNEADTQQFMLPVTIPLVFAIVVGLSFVLNNPDGSIAWWLSVIPFTSPIIMMIRIPFGVNIYTDLLPSVVFLIAGFLATTWIAAKIYRTGILMYGKKTSYKEIWKWLTFKY